MELITDPENVASQRVAEKVGYRREGPCARTSATRTAECAIR